MNKKYFTPTFVKFFCGFVAIVAVGFGVMMVAASQQSSTPNQVDIIAEPK